MAFASSWEHIIPQPQSAAGLSHHPARGSKQQAAEELLTAYQSVPHVKGKLPTLVDLPHTVFCRNPNNGQEGVITYLHPHRPEHALSYCFLRTDSPEAMAKIHAKYDAYTALPGSYPAGEAPLERLPLELMRRITEGLWDNKDIWDDNPDVKSLSQVSHTVRSKLLEVHKANEINKRWEKLPSLPAGQVMKEFNDIIEYTMSGQPVKLVGASLLAAFNHYLTAIVGMMRSDQTYGLIDKRSVIDSSIRIIETMLDEHDQAKALTGLHQHPIPIFLTNFSSDEGFERAEKLTNIVAKMNSADAKTDGIAAIGHLFHMGGVIERERILYAVPLLQLTENLEAGPEAQEKICLAFLKVRRHVVSYCDHHYDASSEMYPLYHNEVDDIEENREADLNTGRQFDAYLEKHDFALPQIGGSFFASIIEPLWQNE